MNITPLRGSAGELVPLGDRVRYMLVFRLLAAFGVAVTISFARDYLVVPESTILAVTAGFGVVSMFAHAGWNAFGRRSTAVFGLMLMADGVFLAWAAYATGGTESPVRYLIVLELLAVSLLASHRTGLKLAIWQSLLLVAIYNAQKAEILHAFDDRGGIGTPYEQMLVFVVVLWVVTIATALFSAINERELRRRHSDLEALAKLTARLERESEPREVAEALVLSLVETFSFDRAVVLGPPDGNVIAPLVGHGAEQPDTPGTTAGEGSVLELAARERCTQLVTQVDPAVDAGLDALLPNARNLVVVPLTAEGGTVGTLVVEHASRPGSRIERRIVNAVERFAAHGALALRNAWLLEEVRDLAANDPLTGLANRMTFGESIDRELSRAHRDGGEVTLVMFDLDHFKRLNDTRGHQAGDEVLRRTAATLRQQQRKYDTSARYGGEEFALIAPGLTAEDAAATAERIRAAIENNGCDVTASVGIATFPRDADNADMLIAAADGALYASKHRGRNRVTQATAAAHSH